MVMACWCSGSASGASVGQEVIILGVPVALAVGGSQMASPESAYIFAMVWAHSALLLVEAAWLPVGWWYSWPVG